MTDLIKLVERLPEGWSTGIFEGRTYGVTRSSAAGGRSISVYAEEFGGRDVVSANVYRTVAGDLLKPCEMPSATRDCQNSAIAAERHAFRPRPCHSGAIARK